MRPPDFFIVGAPKSATTAMYSYLAQHPDTFLPGKKEIQFFGSDLSVRRRCAPDEFHAYFEKADGSARVGTAWVQYLRSEHAPYEIKEYAPKADIIIMLRNPVDMIHALHSQNMYELVEDIPDFRTALDAEPDRRAGRRLSDFARRGVYPIEALFYRDQARYDDHVRRYLDVFGREHVHVVIFDDFCAETASAYGDTLAFLGLDKSFVPEFPVVYANKRVRSHRVQQLLLYTPGVLRTAARRLLPQSVRHALVEANARPECRDAMEPELRASLIVEMRPRVENLSKLLWHDLTHWTAI